jgi:hypothetical protein
MIRDPPDEILMDLDSMDAISDPFGTSNFNASAPLITAASALLGNNYFLNITDLHNNLTATQILH